MSYSAGKKYYLRAYGGTGLYLNVYGNDTIENGRNVCLFIKEEGALAQGWIIKNATGDTKILSAINTSYCLDHWTGTSNYGNCETYTDSSSYNTDQIVRLEPSGSNYKIYNVGRNKYLTATGYTDNSNVKWDTKVTSGSSQDWQLIEWPPDVTLIPATYTVSNSSYTLNYFKANKPTIQISSIRSTTSPSASNGTAMISNFSKSFNQTNSGIVGVDSSLRYACATFALACAMTYYSKVLISPYWLSRSGSSILWDDSLALVKNTSNQVLLSRTVDTTSFTLSNIKSYIDNGKPVILHCTGSGSGEEHWVVVYGYQNYCATKNDLLVMDSVNSSSYIYGESKTLKTAMSDSYISPTGYPDSYTMNRIIVIG